MPNYDMTKDIEMTEGDLKPPSEMDQNKSEDRPVWMKVKKISNKERRRRQNEHLRRLLTPKNALMLLNEMLSKEQVVIQVKSDVWSANKTAVEGPIHRAELIVEGVLYRGQGESKAAARNSAAEQALRDIIIQKMTNVANSEMHSANGESGVECDETIPMMPLACYALHKLFIEWESQGYKVPDIKPPSTVPEIEETEGNETVSAASESEGPIRSGPPKPKKQKILPTNASSMHPCMLLTCMRPSVEYKDLAAEGERPQNMMFTVGLEIDGTTYVGKASNKREARKSAASEACFALFGVQFEPNAVESVPVF